MRITRGMERGNIPAAIASSWSESAITQLVPSLFVHEHKWLVANYATTADERDRDYPFLPPVAMTKLLRQNIIFAGRDVL